eukprot:COSAG01_NODE_5389_length_4291_cov_3.813931_2_plen_68_part_00
MWDSIRHYNWVAQWQQQWRPRAAESGRAAATAPLRPSQPRRAAGGYWGWRGGCLQAPDTYGVLPWLS